MSRVDPGIQNQQLFGRWRFDANTGGLSDGEIATHLEPQVAKLLDYFLTHQNTLISREELIAEVWDGRIVSDDAINRCVSILRQTLSPDEKNAYIETVVRRGFMCHFPPPPAAKPGAASPVRRRNLLALLLLAALALALVYGDFGKFSATPGVVQVPQQHEPPMLAVLPFTSSDMEGDSAFFANGMHDDLLTQLAQLQSIRVISRTSVLEYRDSSQNLREIGRELGADAILEGGIQRVGDQIRINVQLIDAKNDAHLWAAQYDRELLPASIFAVQAEIARSISAELQASLTEQDALQLRILPTENMAAYRAYHRALDVRDARGVRDPEYMQSLQEAVEIDPAFTRAWAELAGYLSYRNFITRDPDSVRRVEQMLEHIRALAPQSADYLIAQSFYTYYILQNYEDAYRLISQAQLLKPSDPQILDLKSWIQRRLGDFDGKIESIRQARKVDPRNPNWTKTLVNSLIINHEYDAAAREVENTASPSFMLLVANSKIQLREHRDLDRWAADLRALQEEFQFSGTPPDLWESAVAGRDYATAESLLVAMRATDDLTYWFSISELPGVDLFRLTTYWLLQDKDKLDPYLARIRAELSDERKLQAAYLVADRLLALAFVSAAEGNGEETRRLIRAWQREINNDLANFSVKWHHACRALGMAGASEDAVKCIQTGLVKPSYVMPFLEPALPYYDPIRNDPEFAGLLTKIRTEEGSP